MSEPATVENVYAAPKVEVTADGAEAPNTFFVVSNTKFLVMYLISFGVYGLYYFYKNFKLIKIAEGSRIIPAMRAIFSVFFVHSLMKRIKAAATEAGEAEDWSAGKASAQYICVALSGFVFLPLSGALGASGNIGWFLIILALWMVMVAVWPALVLNKAQGIVNIIEDDPDGEANNNYTGMNIFLLVMTGSNWFVPVGYLAAGIFVVVSGIDIPLE